MRDPLKGSWFVDVFCEVIAENAWQYDLDDLWSEVSYTRVSVAKLQGVFSHLAIPYMISD